MPEDAWDEAVRTLDPSDVLYVDASIEDNPSVLAAAEHALAHLPRRVRIVLDVSGAFIGPRALPNNNVLMVLDQDQYGGWASDSCPIAPPSMPPASPITPRVSSCPSSIVPRSSAP